MNFILRISNQGGPGVEVEHLRVIAQLFLSSEVFLIFPWQLRLCEKWLFSKSQQVSGIFFQKRDTYLIKIRGGGVYVPWLLTFQEVILCKFNWEQTWHQYIFKTPYAAAYTFSLQNSCTPQVPNDIRTANVHNRPS